jgi:hypothetical protein
MALRISDLEANNTKYEMKLSFNHSVNVNTGSHCLKELLRNALKTRFVTSRKEYG